MATKYSFSNICDPSSLASQITAVGILTALDHIEVQSEPKNTDIWFVSDLSLDEQVKLNSIFNNHLKIVADKVSLTDGTTANTPINQIDTDNAWIVRTKAAKKGWSFWAIPIEITTSTLETMFCQTANGANIPWVSCKIYNGNDQEITTPGILSANLNTCVKTVVDFEPTFDYEIIGGALRINSNPSQDVRLWIVGAPDIPAQFGGSKEFASGINLKFMAPDSSFEIDGRVTKFLTYDANTHQGKMRIILKHPAGLAVNMQIVVHIYRL